MKNPALIREIQPADYPLLEEFQYHAIFVPPGMEAPPREIIYNPDVFMYIDGFGEKIGDCGAVAEMDGKIVGAAWTRIIPAYGHIDDETPELAISVLPAYRGLSVGTKMMAVLFDLLRERGFKRTSLAVQKENAALRFYQRLGYKTVGESAQEFIMIKDLMEPSKSQHELNKNMDANAFRDHYYLKEALVAFCRAHGLPVSGGKIEITERIARFLDTGEVLRAERKSKAKPRVRVIDKNTPIEPDFVCSETHRAFFKAEIGKGFSFNVAFQKWLKDHAGETYADALAAYRRIMEEKKNSKTTIDGQFEYNTYIRAFFEDNKGRNLEDAIRCWKYKRDLPGSHRYEKSDLVVLMDE